MVQLLLEHKSYSPRVIVVDDRDLKVPECVVHNEFHKNVSNY